MWNSFRTDAPPGVIAGGMAYPAGGGESNLAYVARPDGTGPYPGIVLVHHAAGLGRILPGVRAALCEPRLHRDRPEPLQPIRPRHT